MPVVLGSHLWRSHTSLEGDVNENWALWQFCPTTEVSLKNALTSDVHHVIANRFLRAQLGKSKTYRTQFEGKQMYLGPRKQKKIAFFCSSAFDFTISFLKISITLSTFKQHEKPRNDHAGQAAILTLQAQCHYTTGLMSLQRNSALSLCTICFPKPVSELVLLYKLV